LLADTFIGMQDDPPAGNQDQWGSADSNRYPATEALPAVGPSAAAVVPLVVIGDIHVYPDWVATWSGTVPIRGTRWVARERTHIQRVIPSWAIVLAIVLFLACFLGLLFLAVREDVMTGHVEVEVFGADGFYHVTQVPVSDPAQVYDVQRAVAYAQQLAM
jgi:hypothetical protein